MGIFNGKKEYNYFESFLSLAKYASASANYLCEAFDPFDIDKVPEHVVNMHQLEHDADVQNHEITRNLAHEFITPIEREDIAALAQELDSIVDAIEDVMRRIYMFNVTSLRSEALDFTRLIVRCAAAFENVMGEFQHFKRSKTITTYIIEVNTLENEGDRLHADSLRRLFTEQTNADERLVWTTIFESLEACLDICENAADIVEGIVMKNT